MRKLLIVPAFGSVALLALALAHGPPVVVTSNADMVNFDLELGTHVYPTPAVDMAILVGGPLLEPATPTTLIVDPQTGSVILPRRQKEDVANSAPRVRASGAQLIELTIRNAPRVPTPMILRI